MTKSELLNNTEFKNAKGDLPIIYITSDDDVVKIGGIINAPMVGRIYFSEVKKTITIIIKCRRSNQTPNIGLRRFIHGRRR